MKGRERTNQQAVVAGGSIAGLLTAAALAPHYEKVIVVDADALDYSIESIRSATPQSNHVHGLLSSGWKAMQQLVPNIQQGLTDAGAHWVHFGKEFRWHHFGKVKAQFDDLMEGPFMSRACLESVIYHEVSQLKNVSILRAKVKGLSGSAEKVDAVLFEDGRSVDADLVVDASGRESKLPEWLDGIGARRAQTETLVSGLRYCSCRFAKDALDGAEWRALFVIPKPPETKAAAVFPMEDGSWLVTLSGRKNDSMPTDQATFLSYARELASEDVHAALVGAEPLGPLKHYKFKASQRRYYERVAMPSNLLAIGDSVCSFNPIFGQGMTVCALEALKLSELLEAGACDSKNYFKAIRPLVKHAWEMVTVEDMRHPELHSERPLKVKLMQRLTEWVYDRTSYDGALNKMLYEVIHFERPATDLCKPWALGRLLFRSKA